MTKYWKGQTSSCKEDEMFLNERTTESFLKFLEQLIHRTLLYICFCLLKSLMKSYGKYEKNDQNDQNNKK